MSFKIIAGEAEQEELEDFLFGFGYYIRQINKKVLKYTQFSNKKEHIVTILPDSGLKYLS